MSGSKSKQKVCAARMRTNTVFSNSEPLSLGELLQVLTLESDVRLYVQVFGCSSIAAVDVLLGVPDIKLRNFDEE